MGRQGLVIIHLHVSVGRRSSAARPSALPNSSVSATLYGWALGHLNHLVVQSVHA